MVILCEFHRGEVYLSPCSVLTILECDQQKLCWFIHAPQPWLPKLLHSHDYLSCYMIYIPCHFNTQSSQEKKDCGTWIDWCKLSCSFPCYKLYRLYWQSSYVFIYWAAGWCGQCITFRPITMWHGLVDKDYFQQQKLLIYFNKFGNNKIDNWSLMWEPIA